MSVLSVVKVRGSCRWAVKASIQGVSRYRGFQYKEEALRDLEEWAGMSSSWFYPREFNHNFFSAEELGIREINNDG